jgi:hypothetical protein
LGYLTWSSTENLIEVMLVSSAQFFLFTGDQGHCIKHRDKMVGIQVGCVASNLLHLLF